MNRFDKAAAQWDAKSNRVNIAKSAVEAIKARVDLKDKVILDYGCGTGLLAYGLSDDAKEVIGMDSSRGMLEVFDQKAKDMGFENVHSRYHDANDHALEAHSYDVIVSSMTLHHIKDPASFIKECAKALTPGGALCISDLDEEDGCFHSHGNEGVEHFGFSKAQLRSFYEAAGLEVRFLEDIHSVDKEHKSYPILLAVGVKAP